LARDLVFVLLLRGAGRRVIAHLHSGTDLERADRSAFYRAALRLLARASVEVVVLAPSFVGPLRRHGIRATAILNPIPTGSAAPDAARPERAYRGAGPLRLLFVGRFEERKGCRDLVHAVAATRRAGVDAKLVFVGREKYPGYEAGLRETVAEVGLEGVVEFHGPAVGPALVRQYDSSDLVCLPSWREGLPLVVLEAMSRGAPVLATRVGGIPDLVTDGETGLLVEPRDVRALRDTIILASADRARLRAIGSAGRRHVTKLASPEVIEARWRELYERCDLASR
jgi:glycosyltransferase involved in cell wall biosynthesis